ncbi:helix-turn-helix domain-containing protein [Psychrobacillus sp. NPDC096426]|uniref:helix-turn-helix domain-containing protein n=1 Tax=Psychrobacillus sp. NPDC096426 TaxID=3364491 RepID=UPI00382B4991
MLKFKLKAIRESKGISRYRLSRIAGVNESTIQMIENSDDPNPTFKVMCKIADALEVSLDELRRNEDESITNF